MALVPCSPSDPRRALMGDLAMTEDERQRFLADLHVGVVAVEREDGPPLAVPVWYRYAPGGDVELSTEEASTKARLLRSAGRASLCVQKEDFPYAYVSVEGPVSFAEPDHDTRVHIASRYLGDEMGKAYVQGTSGDDVLVRITPERWFTVDYAKL
jgi:PPOX class probable F420-dependent enzyme